MQAQPAPSTRAGSLARTGSTAAGGGSGGDGAEAGGAAPTALPVHVHVPAAAPIAPFASPGCSVEENNVASYTSDFLASLTPRSRGAAALEGIRLEELRFRPLDEFDGMVETAALGTAVAAAAAALDPADPARAAAHAAVQNLRWRDWETARAVALARVRAARRRLISGQRHSVTARAQPETDPAALSLAHTPHGTLPALPARHVRGRSRAHSHSHSHTSSSAVLSASAAFPPHLQLKEHPFFAAHPAAAVAGSSRSAAAADPNDPRRALPATLPGRLEWSVGANQGHLCARMRDHLMRDQERAEWEAEQARREARARRRQEQMQNEFYARGGGSQSARTHSEQKQQTPRGSLSPHASPSTARSTRAEMLRTGGASEGLFSASHPHTPHPPASHPHPHSHSQARIGSGPSSRPGSLGSTIALIHGAGGATSSGQVTRANSPHKMLLNSGAASSATLAAAAAAVSASAAAASSSGANAGAGLGGSPSIAALGSGNYGERVQCSVAAAAARYAALFDAAASKIAARQEGEIRALAAAESARADAQRKQEEIERRRTERARADRARRDAESQAAQRTREAKFARVESEESERVARIEGAWAARQARIEAQKREMESARAAQLASRQSQDAQADEARRQRVEAAYRDKQERLEQRMEHLEEAFQAAAKRLAAEQAAQRTARAHAEEQTRAAMAVAAAQRSHDACEARLARHSRRTHLHSQGHSHGDSSPGRPGSRTPSPPPASRDHAAIAAAQHEAASLRRATRRAAKEATRDVILSERQREMQRRVAAIAAKEAADEERLRAAENARTQAALVDAEKRRIDEARKQRNLERVARKEQFHAAARAEKLAVDLARLDAIAAAKELYATRRASFAKESFRAVADFRDEYSKLRTQGALAKINRQAKQRQKEMDWAHEREQNEMHS